ncbi:MAG: LacI family DNA-binding transcriptional regulator, partial [Bacillota bacterium]
MPTIKDIARKVGVSPSVVSRALNNKYGVKESTRQAVLRAAKELGYHPNVAARSLVTKRTEMIGVIIPDISEPFYSRMIKGMEYVASKTGYTLLFSNSYESLEQSKAVVKMVEAQRVEGLIVVGSSLKERDYIYSLIDKGTPFVVIERHYSDPRMNCIWVDNVVGGYVATKHLIQCGHTRVAHISGDLDVEVAAERLKGYKKALDEAGIPFSPDLVVSGAFVWQDGYHGMKALLSRTPRCTAVFAGNDSMAYGALQAIAEAGLSVPQDISVIGFDDLEFSSLTNPPLTTVRQPRYEMGRDAARLLVTCLEQSTQDKGMKICYPPEIVIRRSTSVYDSTDRTHA